MKVAAIFRAMRAYDRERQSWRVLEVYGSKWLVTDRDRQYKLDPVTAKAIKTKTLYHEVFTEEDAALDFVKYRSMQAALKAALRFWEN